MRTPPFLPAFLILTLLAAPARGQAAYVAPRLSDGHPDLEGDWNNGSITSFERGTQYGERRNLSEDEVTESEGAFADLASESQPQDGSYNLGQGGDLDAFTTVMRVAGEPRTSLITLPADGRVPTPIHPMPEPPTLGDDERSLNPETMTPAERCVPTANANAGPVMLPGEYNNNFRIVQTETAVAIMIQMAGDTRIIRLGQAHRRDGIRPWFGDSIGHWQGDSLVVETTNFPQAEAFYGAWQHLKITETFTRVADDRLLYRFTIEDPTVWSAPWGGEYEFVHARRAIDEYACHENDYTLENAMAGARYVEGVR